MIRIGLLSISPSFLVMMAWLLYWDRMNVLPAALVACTLHELGHLTMIRLFEIDIKEINLTLIGAEIKMESALSYRRDLAVAAAGPLVNLFSAALIRGREGLELFAGLNLALALFNLLPIGGLDGGRMLRGALAMTLGPVAAEEICSTADRTLSLLLLIAGGALLWWGRNLTLLCVAIWLMYLCQKGDFKGKWRKRLVIRGNRG